MNLQQLLDDPPKVHPFKGQLLTWGLPRPALDFIDACVSEGSRTLETGSGLSTVLFALKGASHICITPFKEEVERIRDYCDRQGISLERVDFRVDLSTNVLPGLGSDVLDLALIDGCHGFPTPFIDWYYLATALKQGGTLIVDDVQIWTGRVLRDFLSAEPEWKLIEPYSNKTAIFSKERHYHPWKEFNQQFYVVQQDSLLQAPEVEESRLRKGLHLLGKGQFLTLLRKMASSQKDSGSQAEPPKEPIQVELPPGVEAGNATGEAVPIMARRAAEQAVKASAASAGGTGKTQG